jgi:hypothetical protein
MSGYDIFAWIVLVVPMASAIGLFCDSRTTVLR